MSPIICWDCARLGTCTECNENGCEKFVMWKLTFKEVANLCGINVRTLYRWFAISEKKALRTIYHLTGYRFNVYYDDGHRRCLGRKINKE